MRKQDLTPPVVTLFASRSPGQCETVKIYAMSHPEVKVAAVLSSGSAVLELLRQGLRPAVLVLDLPLEEENPSELLYQIGVISAESEILLSAQTEDEEPLRELLLTFQRCRVILKPWKVTALFEAVYTMGAGSEEGRLYQASNLCSQLLNELRADSGYSGRSYLQGMAALRVVSERELSLAELKRYIAKRYGTDEAAVTSALNRINREMYHKETSLYRKFCVQNGYAEDAQLPVGRLVKSLAMEARYYQNRQYF